MPDSYRWHGALATLGVEAASRREVADPGVILRERAHRAQLVMRGDPSNGKLRKALEDVLGLGLPMTPKSVTARGQHAVLWLGPDEWLLVLPPGGEGTLARNLERALIGVHYALVDVSHSRCVIGLAGARAREVLMKSTNVDVHPRAFAAGHCIHARLARCHMLLHQLDETPAYDIYVQRSFARYAWAWLQDAAREYGVAVKGQ